MNKKEIFKNQIAYIKRANYRESLANLIELLPDYFFEIPASSTGKYHPKFAEGPQGLVRHTKVAVEMAKELLEIDMFKNNFTEDEKDLMLIALVLHDGLKSGKEKEQYTRFDHPILISSFVEEHKDQTSFTDSEIKFIQNVISSHMGQWNTSNYSDVVLPKPTNKYQKFVHMCDYLASRKFINIEFNKDEIVKE